MQGCGVVCVCVWGGGNGSSLCLISASQAAKISSRWTAKLAAFKPWCCVQSDCWPAPRVRALLCIKYRHLAWLVCPGQVSFVLLLPPLLITSLMGPGIQCLHSLHVVSGSCVCSYLGLFCLGLCCLYLIDCFLSRVREIFSYYVFKYFFSGPFSGYLFNLNSITCLI